VPVPARVPDAVVTRAVFYLHGFASGPQSTKAAYFAERLRAHGIELACPDFNGPSFTTLTMSRMLDQLEGELGRLKDEQAAVIGSSLGGALAILAAARFTNRIERLVLLAPAVMIARPGHHLLPADRIEEWRRNGSMPFFHYADQREHQLDYAFYEDSVRRDPFDAAFTQPALIFQGRRDASVDAATVEAFARGRANVTLTLLDDDHQLSASLPEIWSQTARFLGLPA
jgi:uncharacterized protein